MALAISISLLLGAQHAAMLNGARLFVEPMSEARQISIQLFLRADGLPVGMEQAGWRHLLEHLVAVGPDGTLDFKLENAGASLIANTLRSCTRFELLGPPGSWTVMVDSLKTLLQPRAVTKEDIQREIATLEQERAGLSPFESAFERALKHSVFGSKPGWELATPNSLAGLWRELWTGGRAVLVVTGPVKSSEVREQLEPVLSALSPGGEQPLPEVSHKPAPFDSKAQARTWPIPSWTTAAGLAKVAALRAVQVAAPEMRLLLSPSSASLEACLAWLELPWLSAMVGRVRQDPKGWAGQGLLSLRGYLESTKNSPSARGYLRGMLGLHGAGTSLDDVHRRAGALSVEDIQTELEELLDQLEARK